jgi:hypothetical protein
MSLSYQDTLDFLRSDFLTPSAPDLIPPKNGVNISRNGTRCAVCLTSC